MPQTQENKPLDAGAIAHLVSLGFKVTVAANGSTTIELADATMSKVATATPSKNETTLAKQTAWKAKQAAWANTQTARDNMAAHKKTGKLPRRVNGKLYSLETARKLGMVTVYGNPTKAQKAGTKTTVAPDAAVYRKVGNDFVLVV